MTTPRLSGESRRTDGDGDNFANEDSTIRVDVSSKERARHWCKHFGTTKEKIEAALTKVGDNPETVQKELRLTQQS